MATHDINVNGTIANDAVTNAKLANAPEATFKGSPVGAGTDNPVDMDADQASEILDAATDPFARTSALTPFIEDGDIVSNLTFVQGALRIRENAGANTVTINVDEDNTGNRNLNIRVGDADRLLELTGDAEVEGVNTGDQDLSGLLTEADADLLYDALGAAAAAQAASQPLDADLTAIAALTPSNDDIIQRKAGAWTNRSMSQLATDLAGGIRSTLLTGLSLASSAAVAATDSILEAFGKLQAFNNLFTTAGLAIARLANPGAVTFLRINADNTATARSASEMVSDLETWHIIAKATDEGRTSSALAADSALVLPMLANTNYTGTITVYFSASAAGDIKSRVTGPAGGTVKMLAQAYLLSGGSATNRIAQAYDGSDVTQSHSSDFVGRTIINFSIANGVNAGNMEFTWAQVAASGTTSVLAGSTLEYRTF